MCISIIWMMFLCYRFLCLSLSVLWLLCLVESGLTLSCWSRCGDGNFCIVTCNRDQRSCIGVFHQLGGGQTVLGHFGCSSVVSHCQVCMMMI